MDEKDQPGASFRTTQWTLIADAQAGDGLRAGKALGRLCRLYWRPVYHFIRLRGHSPHDAEDLTQGFFEALIEKDYLKSVDQGRGKFRSFLMTATKHFLSDVFDRKRAWKRGGRTSFVSLDLDDAEDGVAAELATAVDPEVAFDRVWASTVLDRSVLRLKQLYEVRGKTERYERLRPCLVGGSGQAYATYAEALGVSEAVVKTEVKRMRQSFRNILRDEVRETLADSDELEAEIRYLGSLID